MQKWQIGLEWGVNALAVSLPLALLGSGFKGVIDQSPLHPDAVIVLGSIGLVAVSLGGLAVYQRHRTQRYQRWFGWGYGGLLGVGVVLGGLALNPPEWLLRLLIPGY